MKDTASHPCRPKESNCFSLSANEFSAPCKSSTSILYSHIIFHSFVWRDASIVCRAQTSPLFYLRRILSRSASAYRFAVNKREVTFGLFYLRRILSRSASAYRFARLLEAPNWGPIHW